MKMSYLQLLLLLETMTLGASYKPIHPDTVHRLLANLTTGYDRRVRPTFYQEQKQLVHAMAFPYSLLELSTEAQRLTMVMFFSMMWWDQFMVWNATEYDGVEQLTFGVDEIWHPKLMINPAYSEKMTYIKDDVAEAAVYSNGSVFWIPGTSVSVLCDVDITFYPFDTQKCPILIYEPFASQDQIQLIAIPYKDLHKVVYHPNQEWHLLNINVTETVIGGSDTIVYTYVFRRRSEFVVYTTIMPLILLAVLNTFVILVPVSSGEKGSIAVTLFLSYCVYLTAIGETLPPNSLNTSLLLVYMTIVHMFSGVTMLYSIIQTKMYIYGSDFLQSCFSCHRGRAKNENKDTRNGGNGEPEIPPVADTVSESGTEKALVFYKRLDTIAFLACFALNATIVAVFTVLIVNNLHDAI